MLIQINSILLLVLLDLNTQIPNEKTKTESKKTSKEVPISKINKTLSYYIVFENGKTELSNDMKKKLDRVARVFRTNSGDTLTIMSDTKMIPFYKERSISVNNYLISKGVPHTQIRFIEVGKLKVTKEIQLILME